MSLTKNISELEIGNLFPFSKKGAVHMVTYTTNLHIEYKSYSDGKIRVAYLDRYPIFVREEWDKIYEAKWFNTLNLTQNDR